MSCRVALINPISKDEVPFIRIGRCQTHVQPGIGIWPPIDLALIGGELKKINGISDVWLYDAQIDGNYYRMVEKILIYSPSIVIINCTTPTQKSDIGLASIIKRKIKDVLIIFYGMHVTVKSEEVLKSGVVDCCVLKEPETTIKELCSKYIKSKMSEFGDVKNISTYINNKISKPIYEKINNEVFLNSYPDRSLINNENYRLHFNNRVFTIIQTSRGCKNRCIYCTSSIYTPRYYTRTVDAVIDEIKEIYYKYKIKDIMFLSDTFTADKEWIIELCKKIIDLKLNLNWCANSRADTIDYEIASWMKKAGCWLISLGIESGDKHILNTAKKNIKLEDIRSAVNILKHTGIYSIGYFMFGLPGETIHTIKKTIKFARSLPLDYAYFFLATPFPGTRLYDMAVKNKWLITEDWEQYSHGRNCLLKYDNLDINDLNNSVKKAYIEFYLRPTWILSQLKNVKSLGIFINFLKAGKSLLKER